MARGTLDGPVRSAYERVACVDSVLVLQIADGSASCVTPRFASTPFLQGFHSQLLHGRPEVRLCVDNQLSCDRDSEFVHDSGSLRDQTIRQA